MFDVFISYKTEDEHFAEEVFDFLLIRRSIVLKDLLLHMKTSMELTPNGREIFTYFIIII